MAVYTYTAVEGSRPVKGTVAADTPRHARDLLRERGLEVRSVESAAPKARTFRTGGRRRHSAKTLIFVRELSTLLGVGLPLVEAIDTIAKQHDGAFLTVLQDLRDRIAAGSSLAAAMQARPEVFDEITINLVETGEDTGSLEQTLQQLAEFRERSGLMKSRLATALIYPAIVLTMALGSTLLLMTFVVPRILEPLVEEGRPLPMVTRVVKAVSDAIVRHGWLIAIAAVSAIALIAWLFRNPASRRAIDRWLLKLPLIGDIAVKQEVVRVCFVLGTLLKGGVVFEQAIRIAQRATGNTAVRDALAAAEQKVRAGEEIGDAVERTGVFPPLVTQVFAVGQQSGRLEEMLDRLAVDYDAQVSLTAQRFAAVLEPLLVILLAVLVLVVVLATLLPILEVGNVLQ